MSAESIIGKTTVDVECLTPRTEPDLCDGWCETVELDEPAHEVADRVVLPGFDGRCPECGDSTFKIEGVEMMFHV